MKICIWSLLCDWTKEEEDPNDVAWWENFCVCLCFSLFDPFENFLRLEEKFQLNLFWKEKNLAPFFGPNFFQMKCSKEVIYSLSGKMPFPLKLVIPSPALPTPTWLSNSCQFLWAKNTKTDWSAWVLNVKTSNRVIGCVTLHLLSTKFLFVDWENYYNTNNT